MKAKFYKNVVWLEPFFYTAKGLVPLSKVRTIRGYSVSYVTGHEATNASCVTETSRTFDINILTHHQRFQINDNGTYSPKRHRRRIAYDMLGDFAHELAHVVHWEHTPEHWLLECKIQRRFISLIKKWEVTEVAVRNPKWLTKNQP